MLVYGDVESERDAAELQRGIVERLRALETSPAGLQRHSELVSLFIEAGDLIGGLVDRQGKDDLTVIGLSAMDALTRLARCVDRSWRSGSAESDLRDIAARIAALDADGAIKTKPAEGYAFYALYPESYAEAARQSGLPATTRVIGIRSIGTTLSAMVAAGLGAEAPVTVRPRGHPFDRRLVLTDRLRDHVLANDPQAFAIVDEGPGLSGSSFASVIDWLVDHGVAQERIHLFPSHLNRPGQQASAARQKQWRAAPKHMVSFDDLVLGGPLQGWVEDTLGPLRAPLRDISGGGWRALNGSAAAVAPSWEKRKFLAETDSGPWLIKFSGLGAIAARKAHLAQRLHEAGYGPKTAGVRNGFIMQRWVKAPSLPDVSLPPADLIGQLADYLAFRSTLITAPYAGAAPERLEEMAIYNAGQALGEDAATAMRRHLAHFTPHEPVRRVEVDARMHRWEWLVVDGRLLKTDALDHAQGHDFIGAQPVEWDIAGAIVEHDLTAAELIRAFENASGQRVDAGSIAFYLACYLAFQIGAWTMSSGADAPIVAAYGRKLDALLRK